MTSVTGEDGGRGWTIAMGDAFTFEIVPAERLPFGVFGSDADLNGTYPTKLAAVESLVSDFEDTRIALAEQIARAKRMRRALSAAHPTNTTSGSKDNG